MQVYLESSPSQLMYLEHNWMLVSLNDRILNMFYMENEVFSILNTL